MTKAGIVTRIEENKRRGLCWENLRERARSRDMGE